MSGASSGIGAATAHAFARRGARVLLLARSRLALEGVAATIASSGGVAFIYDVDLSDGVAAEITAGRIRAEHGVPDIIVNCAGAGRWLFTEETSSAEAVAMMGAPYFAAFFLTRPFLSEMIARGSGRIVNVTSPASFAAWPGATGYVAARWALRGFTQALRADLQGTGVSVTLVTAGEVESSYWRHNPDSRERLPRIARAFPVLTPDQVAAAIVHAVERERSEVVIPFALRVALAAHQVWPWPLERLLLATGWHHSR